MKYQISKTNIRAMIMKRVDDGNITSGRMGGTVFREAKRDALFSSRAMVWYMSFDELSRDDHGPIRQRKCYWKLTISEPCSLNFIGDSIVQHPRLRSIRAARPLRERIYRVSASTTFPPHNSILLFSITSSLYRSSRLSNASLNRNYQNQ